MPIARRFACLAILFATSLGSGGCTLVKPVIGAVTGPVVMLGNSGGDFGGCGCGDGRAAACFFLGVAAVGAVAGLATGLVSDVQALCGRADDPCNNWWDPFATNTMETSW